MQHLSELEGDLAELRAAYDQYFQGNERLPPLKRHDAFKKQYLKMKGSSVRQTAVKFRLESIGQKLLTYERLWERTLKEIENGTYKRDLARLKRHQKDPGQKKSTADFDVDEDLDLSDLDSGEDDLSSVIAAAEKAVEAVTARPATPAIPPVKPLTGVAPAIMPAVPPVTPSGGVKPAAPVAGLKPITNPFAQAAAPVAPPKITSGSFPAVTPAGPPKITSGSFPAVTPAGPPKITGAFPAVTPAGAPKVTGAGPAVPKGAASVAPAGPPKVTGALPAVTPKMPSGPLPAPPRPAVAAPRAPTGGDGGLSDQKIKAIYDAYVMAKKRTGEDTRAITLDSVASSLKKQVPELMKQHNAKSVEVKVVIKDGKAILRALPKE